jgi:transcriptional regulator with XRE-family HTH domain
MTRLRRADTPLAEWLAEAMSGWVDPETRMPGISQRKLARETGISQAQLHEVLKKGHSPGPDILKKLAAFFGADPLALFRLAYLNEKDAVDITQEVTTE